MKILSKNRKKRPALTDDATDIVQRVFRPADLLVVNGRQYHRTAVLKLDGTIYQSRMDL